jgi:4-amino-4-deoxy-L-arabinose transferase-like glycosyltransferase
MSVRRIVPRIVPYLEGGLFLLILALAAYLRLANLADNPGWYTDEGANLMMAQSLAEGRVQYMAINRSILLFARMPLFEGMLAALLRVFGGGIVTLRTFTGTLGLTTVPLSYWTIRRIQRGHDRVLPLLAALAMAIYPAAVVYSRFGFTYNLLAPLILLVELGLWEYMNASRRGWLALAAIAVGLGMLSDVIFITLTLPVGLVVLWHNRRDVWWSLLLMALPLGIYVGGMLLADSAAFLFDLSFTLGRVGGRSLVEQIHTIGLNLRMMVEQDVWVAPAIIGLFLLRPNRLARLCLLLFLLPLVMMARTFPLYSLSRYYLIPLLPFVALGMAALIRYGVPAVFSVIATTRPGHWRWAAGTLAFLVAWLVFSPLLSTTGLLVQQVQTRFVTAIDPFLLDPHDCRLATDYVNAHSIPTDLVIASPGLAWRIQAHTADFQMAVAETGQDTPHVPGDLPPDRWAYDSRLEEARYVVVDNLWRAWAVPDVPGVAEMLQTVQGWEVVFQSGEVTVYCRPADRP